MIETKRLLLRQWEPSDLALFAEMNADSRVREFFPSLLNPEESNTSAERIMHHIDEKGWGFWAVSVLGGEDFIGFVGLNTVPFNSHFTPAIEVGWRLTYESWNKGYATEGALASLEYGFDLLGLNEIVSFTTPQNTRSCHVMEKIGMHNDPKDNFLNPTVRDGSPIREHLLYRITWEDWFKD